MFRAIRIRNLLFPTALLLIAGILSACDSSADRAQSHYERGLELAQEGEPVKASLEFRNALKLDNQFTAALFELGKAEEQQQNFESAFRIYNSVAEQDQEHVASRVRMASILLAANQLDPAMDTIEDALALEEGNPAALVVKATIELKLNNRGEATRLANQVLEQNPTNPDALTVLASERLLASDPEGALAFLDQAPPESERNVGMQILRLTALDSMKDSQGVEEQFVRLIELFPETQAFNDGLVRWYLANDRQDDAEQTMRDFVETNPDDEEAKLKLIAFLNSVKSADEAIAQLEDYAAAPDASHRIKIGLAALKFENDLKPEAMSLMRDIIENAANDVDRNSARIRLARMHLNANEVAEAGELVKQVIDADAKNVDALTLRAAIRMNQDEFDDAIEDLLAASNEAPDNPRISSLLAEAYERSGSSILAEEQYAKALSLDNSSPTVGVPMARFLLRYGKTDQAIRVLESVRERAPQNIEVLQMLAQMKLTTGDWLGAQEIADQLRSAGEENNLVADQISAAALGGLDRFDDSIELLENSAKTSNNDTATVANLVRTYMQSGRVEAAENYLNSILEENPDNLQATILLASLYSATNRLDLAEETYKSAAAKDEEGVVGITALSQFYSSAGNFADAEATAKTGLERAPQNMPLHLLLAGVYERQERYEDAIAEYELMYELDSDSTIVANGLASLLSERRGDEEALERAYDIALRFRNSEIPHFLDTLGWIYYLREDYVSALPLLKSAAERLPGVPLVQLHYGMVLKELEQNESATEVLTGVLVEESALSAPDREKAQQAIDEIAAAMAAQSADAAE